MKRGDLLEYEELCEHFFTWNFHNICERQLDVIGKVGWELESKMRRVLNTPNIAPRDYFPRHYPLFYKAYKVLHEDDPSDRFLPETQLDRDGLF